MDIVLDSLRNRWPVISLIAELLFWIVTFIDEMHLFLLLVFAALFSKIGEVTSRHDEDKAKYLTFLFAFAYVVHLWPLLDFTNDVIGILAAIIRTVFAATVVHHLISVPLMTVCLFSLRYLQEGYLKLVSQSEDLQRSIQTTREQREIQRHPDPPLPPREDVIRQQTNQAQLDYDFECSILEQATLDNDEREMALEAAKQKYLHRIQSTLE